MSSYDDYKEVMKKRFDPNYVPSVAPHVEMEMHDLD